MKFFISNDFLDGSISNIARFLRATPQLSKAAIGDYLGDADEVNVKVMHAFVDQIEFAGLDFVAALRMFLQDFRLPGEAQKIDRLMEKFADRYCEGNPTIFAKADTAYTLAFSVIMLNTDQHSSQIKHRMDVNDFIKNNRGINDESDLPEEFLVAIFNEISGNEFVLADVVKVAKITMGWGAGDLNEKQRLELYKMEAASIHKKSEMLMSNPSRNISPFKIASSKDLSRPMFLTSSWAIMAALSLQFEAVHDQSELKEQDTVDLCLSGLTGGIKIACFYQLETEKDAYITSLAKLTNLNNFYQLTPKNVKAIKALVQIAQTHGDDLQKCWIHIVKAISQLDMLQSAVNQDHGHKISSFLVGFSNEMRDQNSLIGIDKIFAQSIKLTATSIINLFKAVCQASLDEVGLDSNGKQMHDHTPRMYLLQKIVELTYYNMSRIRFEWVLIWRILQPHFNIVACHSNQNVATFAVDSLRQLGNKILEREELGHFSSQHEFLKSFEWIMKHTQSHITRELVLSSLVQMIHAKANSIRSGWKSILLTLLKAAQTDPEMKTQAFGIIQVIFKDQFEHLIAGNVFVDLVSCLAEFALLPGQGPVHDEQVMGSIQLLQSCTKSLMQRADDELSAGRKSGMEQHKVNVDKMTTVMLTSPHAPKINNLPQQPYLLENGHISEEHFYLSWFPILSAFSRVVIESDGVLVRTHTLETLFETLRSAAPLFEASYWKAIQRNVISPIFDDLSESANIDANTAVLIMGLRNLVDLISMNFDSIDFLQRSLDRMIDMMGKHDEKLASTGQICLHQFLLNNSKKLAEMEDWEWLFVKIERVFSLTLPFELINCDSGTPLRSDDPSTAADIARAQELALRLGRPLMLDELDFERAVIKCVTHLEWVQTIRSFALAQIGEGSLSTVAAKRSPQELQRILDCLHSSYVMARTFNCNIPLRHAIYKKGWVAQLPNLVKQETTSYQAYLMVLFNMVQTQKGADCTYKLVSECTELLERCVKYCQDLQKHQRDLVSWTPTLVLIYKLALDVPHKYLPRFYRYAIRLLSAEQQQLKQALLEFLERIAAVIFKDGEYEQVSL